MMNSAKQYLTTAFVYRAFRWTALLLLLVCFSKVSIAGTPYFEFTDNAQKAYKSVLSLKFDEARTLLEKERIARPDNLITDFVENYIDFFTVFINEDKSEFEELEPNKHSRLKRIAEGPKDSPYFLYTQAEIQLQWAIARMKFEENLTALREIRKAYKMLEENQRKFPDFVASKKSLGVMHAMIGTIPDSYMWAVRLVGLDGTIAQGTKEIKEVLDYAKTNELIFEEETLVMYALILLHIGNESEEAWTLINNPKLDAAVNPLACFVLASVAMHTGRSDRALKLLNNKPSGREYHPFHYLEYMLGMARLYTLDKGAETNFKHYLKHFKGQNYIKEAHQKLAWHSILFEDGVSYADHIQRCKTEGSAIIGGDKKALKEAQYGPRPSAKLLEARLLFDGGYLKRAEQLLAALDVASFQPRDQIELAYRKGRVYQELGKDSAALESYQTTINTGRYEPYYFACNAALQAGLIYEDQGNLPKAKQYYEDCLDIVPDEYKNSLHAKAKAGLNRIKNN